MMKNYSLFYSYKNLGDILIVIFDNEKKPTRHERKGKVEIIYHEDEIIGYNVFDISEVIKIKTQGKIFLPSPILIKVINTILKNSGVEELDEIKESGYVIGKVIKENDNDIQVDIHQEIISVKKEDNIKINDYIVIAKKGTMLNSGQIVKEDGHICNEKELQISDSDKPLVFKEEAAVGMDFFMEEKK